MQLLNHRYQDEQALRTFIEANRLLASDALLVQIFSSGHEPAAVYAARDTLNRLLPEATVIGTSTAGVVSGGALVDGEIILSFSVFEHSTTASVGYKELDVEEIVDRLEKEVITDETRLLIVFANTFRFDSTALLASLSRRFPGLPVAGGNAGDDYRFERCEVFTQEAKECDVVMAAVNSESLEVSVSYLLNWESLGQEMRVTKAGGTEVMEINHRRALDVFRHYLGNEVADNMLEYGIEFPLIYRQNGTEVARAAVGVDTQRGSISFAGEVPEGVYVRFGYANIEHIEEANKKMLAEAFPKRNEAIYVYSCGSRRHLLGNFLEEELSCIDLIAPTAGFITYGEFFHNTVACKNNLLNITTTFAVLNETPHSRKREFSLKRPPRDKKDVTLKALTTLIRKTSDDLDETVYYLEQFRTAVCEAAIFSIADETGVITAVNKNFENISGYSRDELIGAPHNIVRHEEVPKELFKEMWDTIQDGRIWKGMIKNKSKDGRPYYVISEIVPIYNKDGSFREYIAIRNDVTELEEYKQLLKYELDTTSKNLESNILYMKQYEDAINSTTAILKTDTDNIIKYANEKFCELSGYTLDELVGVNCEELRHQKHRIAKICVKIREELAQKHVVQRVMTNVAKDGHEYVLNNLFYPIVDVEGKVIEYLQVMYDITEIINLNEEIVNTQKEVVLTMGAIGETRSKETGLHVKRVAAYSYLLAKLIGLSEEEASLLKQASPMHDIGKVGIPDRILNKPGKLTQEEFEVMKTHAEIGYEMLKHSEREILKASAVVAYTHHEKWDGSGYPRGLCGEDIHIYGRITALADVFDALGHDRVYKKAWPLEKIYELLREGRGQHFDPDLVDVFFENLDQFLEIHDQMQD